MCCCGNHTLIHRTSCCFSLPHPAHNICPIPFIYTSVLSGLNAMCVRLGKENVPGPQRHLLRYRDSTPYCPWPHSVSAGVTLMPKLPCRLAPFSPAFQVHILQTHSRLVLSSDQLDTQQLQGMLRSHFLWSGSSVSGSTMNQRSPMFFAESIFFFFT